MKKTSMLLWCSVLVIFLVACGPSESSSGSSSPSSSSFSQNSSADATSKSVEQDESVENVAVTISITDWDNTTGDSVLIESEGTYTGEMGKVLLFGTTQILIRNLELILMGSTHLQRQNYLMHLAR